MDPRSIKPNASLLNLRGGATRGVLAISPFKSIQDHMAKFADGPKNARYGAKNVRL